MAGGTGGSSSPRKWARVRNLEIRFVVSEGAGSHGTLYAGDRKTTPYRPPQYRLVMLPMVVLRRLDCVLEPTKDGVLKRRDELEAQQMPEAAMDRLLGKAADPPPIIVRIRPDRTLVGEGRSSQMTRRREAPVGLRVLQVPNHTASVGRACGLRQARL